MQTDAKFTKGKCPDCGSDLLEMILLPDEEKYLYCNRCQQLKIKIPIVEEKG